MTGPVKSVALCCALALSLMACENAGPITAQEAQELPQLDAIAAANLTEIMLTVSDPEDAVDYFREGVAREPDNMEFRRGLGQSLARAGRYAEAALIYERINEEGLASDEDRLIYAEILVRENAFQEASVQLALVPDQPSDYRYNLLKAVIADHFENWAEADQFYARARGLTTRPTAVLNNWGVSRMSRGDLNGAMLTFREAVTLDPAPFRPRNNLVIARGLSGIYTLPVIPMTEEERAQLYHNLALVALRQGELELAKGLLRQAVDAHPRFFPAASDKLAALEAIVEL
ncbi:MAG: tetratricopeptide repeat protein [Pseudomonadota bacterium]